MKKIFIKLGLVLIIFNLVGCGANIDKKGEELNTNNIEAKNINYVKYINERFGFSIEYPDYLEVIVDPDNGDGIKVGDKDLKLTVSGSYNVLSETPESMEEEIVKTKSNISYKEKGKDFFVASWLEGDKVIYEYRKVGENMIQGFILEYNESKIKEFEPIVNKIYKSFKASEDI